MYSGIYKKITPEELINNISQEEVFQSMLGYFPNLYQKFKSPFRSDRVAGCRFEWRDNYLCLVENTRYKNRLYWNIFQTYMELHSCDFNEAIKQIAKGRFEGKSKPIIKDKLSIRFTNQQFSENNLFKVSPEILLKENIFLVQDYYSGRDGFWKKNFLHKSLCIAYYFPNSNHVKLYWPLEEENRWYSNCDNNDIFGLSSLNKEGELLIISKSQKDRITLKYHYGYENVIAVQNEGCYIPENIMDNLKLRFKQIIVIFDNDDTGLKESKKLASLYNIEYKQIDSIYKDPYEMFINNQIITFL